MLSKAVYNSTQDFHYTGYWDYSFEGRKWLFRTKNQLITIFKNFFKIFLWKMIIKKHLFTNFLKNKHFKNFANVKYKWKLGNTESDYRALSLDL